MVFFPVLNWMGDSFLHNAASISWRRLTATIRVAAQRADYMDELDEIRALWVMVLHDMALSWTFDLKLEGASN